MLPPDLFVQFLGESAGQKLPLLTAGYEARARTVSEGAVSVETNIKGSEISIQRGRGGESRLESFSIHRKKDQK